MLKRAQACSQHPWPTGYWNCGQRAEKFVQERNQSFIKGFEYQEAGYMDFIHLRYVGIILFCFREYFEDLKIKPQTDKGV